MQQKIDELIKDLRLTDYDIRISAGDVFRLQKQSNKAFITYERENQVFLALEYLSVYREEEAFEKVFEKAFDLNFMVDCSRNAVMNIPALKRLIDKLARLGYERLILYMEDGFEIPFDEYFGHLRGRYSKDELKELAKYAASYGMEVLPCFQTLAHLNQYFKWRGSFSLLDCDDILLCDDENTYAFLESVIKSLSEIFTIEKFMIGMDEARLLGAGKYFDRHGYVPRKEIFFKHLNRVAGILAKYGKIGMLWSDSLFTYMGISYFQGDLDTALNAEDVARLPDNVELIYWNYGQDNVKTYEKKLIQHQSTGKKTHFGGSTVGPANISPMNELAAVYLDCAMKACKKVGVESFSLYHWGDDGSELSVFATLPSICYCSAFCYQIDNERLFYDVFGVKLQDFMLLDDVNKPYDNKRKYDHNVAEYFKNISKYTLYNDVLLGLCDANVEKCYAKNYAVTLKALETVDAGAYQYVFDTQIALVKLLCEKATAGLELKELYDAKDLNGLTAFVGKLEKIKTLITAFSETYQKQWLTDNKVFGLEIFHQRIGGLLQRTQFAIGKIKRFVNGDISAIEELEEKRLSYDKNLPEGRKDIPYAKFTELISANKL